MIGDAAAIVEYGEMMVECFVMAPVRVLPLLVEVSKPFIGTRNNQGTAPYSSALQDVCTLTSFQPDCERKDVSQGVMPTGTGQWVALLGRLTAEK
jgi:hypothetical protein